MGSVCNPQASENLKNYKRPRNAPTVESSISNKFQNIKFTACLVSKLKKEEALILFVDQFCNVTRNQFLGNDSPEVGHKIQEYLDVAQQSKLKIGQCLVFDVSIRQINMTKIVVICISVWETSNTESQKNLQKYVQNAFDLLAKQKVKSVCITNFNVDFGVPSDIGDKILANVALKNKQLFSNISVLLRKQSDEQILAQLIKKLNESENEKQANQGKLNKREPSTEKDNLSEASEYY